MKSLAQVHHDTLTEAYRLLLPETALVGAACALFLAGAFAPRKLTAMAIALAGLAVAAGLTLCVGVEGFAGVLGWQEISLYLSAAEGSGLSPRTVAPFDPTGIAPYVRWVALASGLVFTLLSWSETRDDNASEYLACVLVVAAGLSVVGRANDLVSLFLALELISVPTYVLLYLPIRARGGQEAAVKYFLLSILSSAFLLFGFSYLYGLTGSTNVGAVVDILATAHKSAVNPLAMVAIILVVAGLAFRIAAVPFHFYAPDVYEGGPTGVVAQLSFVPKVAGFVALARLLGYLAPANEPLPFGAQNTLLPLTLWVLAVVTMTFGNLLALLQDNLKRLLAYSGIAHGGYMLIGLVVAASLPDADGVRPSQTGLDSILFYLVAYGLMTVGAFAVALHLSGPDQAAETVDDLAGLGQSHPVAAGALAVLLFSLIGLPLTAGFIGKFLLFVSAFDVSAASPLRSLTRLLAVIAAVNAAVGAVYYLRILGVLYLRTPLRPTDETKPRRTSPALAVGVACAVATLALGVYPKPLADGIRDLLASPPAALTAPVPPR